MAVITSNDLSKHCFSNGVALIAAVLILFGFLHGCSSGGGYGYGDGPPPKDIDVSNIPNAVPKVEPITKAGNPNPYTIMGKTYRLLPIGTAYKEQGVASWYGNKFHGRKTSNGETYNMYGMTAAHKTLRIPAYVKVTNLENKRSVIVRVNDRGPFHGNRIIDLSYAAAKKLGYSAKGTARVEVELIDPRKFDHFQHNRVEQPHLAASDPTPVRTTGAQLRPAETNTAQPHMVKVDQSALKSPRLDSYNFQLPGNTFLQAGAFSSEDAAKALLTKLQKVTPTPVVIRQKQQASAGFKVLLGPLTDNIELLKLRNLLLDAENIKAFVVYD